MTIGVDADGVLFDYVRTCADFVNRFYFGGREVATYENAAHFDVLKAWGVPQSKAYVDRYFDKPHRVYDLPVIHGAVEFIEDLRRVTNNDFVIITACPSSWHQERERSLGDNFGIDRKKIHFSHDKKLFRLAAHIDDYHMNLDGMEGWRILLDRPWNQDTQGVQCDRAFGFTECLAKINRILLWNK